MSLAIDIVTACNASSPWLMMVHGVSQDRRVFSAQIEYFSREFNLLLVDLPGHGQSVDMDGPYGLVEFADSLCAAQDKAGITASHFWGTHLGAGAGLILAAQYPHRVHSLIVEAPVLPGYPLPSVTGILDKVRHTAIHSGVDAARHIWLAESPWFAVMREHPIECRLNEHNAMVASFTGKPWLDSRLAKPVEAIDDELALLDTPVLIINGEYDLADFIEVAGTLRGLMRNTEHIFIPGGGGFPLWEYPDTVNATVSQFLQKCSLPRTF